MGYLSFQPLPFKRLQNLKKFPNINYSYVFNCRGGLNYQGGLENYPEFLKRGGCNKKGGWKSFPKNDENAKKLHENERISVNFRKKIV